MNYRKCTCCGTYTAAGTEKNPGHCDYCGDFLSGAVVDRLPEFEEPFSFESLTRLLDEDIEDRFETVIDYFDEEDKVGYQIYRDRKTGKYHYIETAEEGAADEYMELTLVSMHPYTVDTQPSDDEIEKWIDYHSIGGERVTDNGIEYYVFDYKTV